MTSWLRVGVLAAVLGVMPAVQAQAAPRKEARKAQPPAPTKGEKGASEEVGRQGPKKLEARVPKLEEGEKGRLAALKREESITRLQDILPSIEDGSEQKAELLYRLSELYWEKSKYLYFQEMAAHERAVAERDAAVQRGEKRPEPKPDNRQSELLRSETMRLYEAILKEYPAYARKDEVLFNLGFNLYETGKKAEAVKRYTELIKGYPQSQFVGDAYVQVGNHWFDVGDVLRARDAYEHGSKSKDPRIYAFSVYRLAWCDFNVGEFEAGLERLQEVVGYAEANRASDNRALVDLKSESLNDMVLFFVRLDRTEDAIAYYRQKTSKGRFHRLVEKLAATLFEVGAYDSAIHSYRLLINEDPMSPRAPELQQAVVRAFEGLRQRDSVREEIRTLASLYSPGSAWWAANAKNEQVLRNAFNVTEEAMRSIVTDYHREAQKTDLVETYRLARDIYKQYVDKFASSEDPAFVSDHAFNLRFYYAEILWTLAEWQAAAEQYEAVVDFQVPERETAKEVSDQRYRRNAANNAILAYEKLVRIERGLESQEALRDGQKVREDARKGGVEKGKRVIKRDARDLQPRELTPNEAKLVAACDRYLTLFPDQKDEIDIRYEAAVLFYDANQFVEATRRFGDIIQKFPTESRSQDAADLSMHVLNAKEEWQALNRLSRELLANKRLYVPGSDFHRRLTAVVEGSQYKYVDEVIYRREKDPKKAAELFLAFVKEFPRSENADRALTYVMFIADDANELDKGVVAGQRVLKEYPKSRFDLKVRYTLARFYERLADFRRSAEMYESFVAAYAQETGKPQEARRRPGAKAPAAPKEAVAKPLPEEDGPSPEQERRQLLAEAERWLPDAQYNAGVWWEGLGESQKAIAAFARYIERFRSMDDAPKVALRIAQIHERDQRWAEAIEAFEDFGTTYARDLRVSPAEHYRAVYRRMLAWRELKNDREADRLLADLVRAYAKLPEEDRKGGLVQQAYAHARFLALEPLWKAYTDIKFDKVATLRRDLQAKQRRIKEVEKAYTDVLGIGVADWGIAALTRIGMAYADMAENILGSPDPESLSPEQLDMYRAELENLALPLEDKCIEALEKALEKAYELTVYNDWMLQAQDKVNQYRRGTYADRREVPFRGSEFFRTASLLMDASEAKPRPSAQAPEQTPPTDAAHGPPLERREGR